MDLTLSQITSFLLQQQAVMKSVTQLFVENDASYSTGPLCTAWLQSSTEKCDSQNSDIIQGVPKKTLFLVFLAITPLWKGLGRKVGGVLKTSGDFLCGRHKNFPN